MIYLNPKLNQICPKYSQISHFFGLQNPRKCLSRTQLNVPPILLGQQLSYLIRTTSITCETTEINNLETGIVSVRIDGYELRFQSGLFSYVNLEVSLTEDRFITPAGGFIVRVDVSDVRGLHAPYLEVFDALTSDTVNKPCEGLDVDEVVCESPAYSYSSNLSVYFVVDNLRRDLQGITPAANNPNCTQTYISRNNIIIQVENIGTSVVDRCDCIYAIGDEFRSSERRRLCYNHRISWWYYTTLQDCNHSNREIGM